MGKVEPFLFKWDKFEAGMVTSVDRNRLDANMLGANTTGLYPYKRGNLALRPRYEAWKSDYASHGGFHVGTPYSVVGMHVWRPVSGRDILVAAVYGNWTTLGRGTLLCFFFDDNDATDHAEYGLGAVAPVFIRGDGPVRFAEFPKVGDYTLKRSNHLVVCSPYDYTRLIEYYESELGYNDIDPQTVLPYFALDAMAYQSRLVLVLADQPHRLAYSANAYDVVNFYTIDVGEETGDPNTGITGLYAGCHVLKSKSIWTLEGATPEQWRPVKVLSQRGSVLRGESSVRYGLLCADERGIHFAAANQEQDAPVSDAVPELVADPYDSVAFFDKIWVESKADFDSGAHNNTIVLDLATNNQSYPSPQTNPNPIDVLTIEHPAATVQDQQTDISTGAHAIAPTEEDYQTFRATNTADSTSTRYWATGIELYLDNNSGANSDCYVEFVRWEGADPANPDEEEILWADLVTNIGAASWVSMSFTDAIYMLMGDGVSKYMIRVTGVTNTTGWYYKSVTNPYTYGEASLAATTDFAFKVYGYQFYASGEWNSRWYLCTDIMRWGALLYSELLRQEHWPLRVSLAYRFRAPGLPSTPMTAWQTFSGTPSGGALTNQFLPNYTEIQFRAILYTVEQMPPFIDYFMVTFSRMIEEMNYPNILEDSGEVYCTGLNPDKTKLVQRHPDEPYGLFLQNDAHFGPLAVWRGKLWAGSISGSSAGSIMRLHRDSDTGDPFMPVAGLIEAGYQGSDDPRVKKCWTLYSRWIQYGHKDSLSLPLQVTFTVRTDKKPSILIIPKLGELECRPTVDGRYEWTLKHGLEDNVFTKDATVEVLVTPKVTTVIANKPYFEHIQTAIIADAWPDMEGAR